jgi:hypothetical protein
MERARVAHAAASSTIRGAFATEDELSLGFLAPNPNM